MRARRALGLGLGFVVALSFGLGLAGCGRSVPRDGGPGGGGGRDGSAGDGPRADARVDAGRRDTGVGGPVDASVVVPDSGFGGVDAGTSEGWQHFMFPVGPMIDTPCHGDRFVRFNERYGMWIGAIRCTHTRYKLLMAKDRSGPYFAIGDFAGSGQDHCELVNPSFVLNNEDDIKSGGCAECNLGPMSNPTGSMGWSRAFFGQEFQFEESWPEFNLYTAQWYECGVSI